MKYSNLLRRITKSTVLSIGMYLLTRTFRQIFYGIHLENKVVLITGGSRGLGLVLARQLADEGAKIVICGRSDESLQKASEILEKRAAEFLAVPCDISDKQQVKRMISQIRDEMGSVDILINNAGIIQTGPMELMNDNDYKAVMDTHFWGPLHLIYEVLPDMKRKRTGRIVNIASIGGKISFPHLLPYNASKFALAGLSEGVTAELSKYNIKVTTVYPGLMRTGSPRNIDVKGQHKKEYAWFKISDSLPFISMDAEKAAHRIVDAMKNGDKTLTLSLPAKLAISAHALAPRLSITVFKAINYLLPDKPDRMDSSRVKKGYQSESKISESAITKKTDQAAEKNLEIKGEH